MEGMYRTEPASTLVYGPLLLARSKFIGNTEEEMFGAAFASDFGCRVRRIAVDGVHCAFEAEFTNGGRLIRTPVCDYASAGNAILDDIRFFSIYF